MARNLFSNTISGNYSDGTNLLPIIRTTLAAELSTVGITGTGLPNIYILGLDGIATSGISLKLSEYSKIAALPKISSYYCFEVGVYTDDLTVPINELTLVTDTPSATTDIRLNYFYEPIR